MLFLIICFPFFSFLCLSFFGSFFGVKGSRFVVIINMLVIFSTIITLFFKLLKFSTFYSFIVGIWLNSGLFTINWSFIIDDLVILMLVIVSLISILVHLYSLEYMEVDPHFIRFMSYLTLFTFFMILLVTADNFIQLFLGWEGVGFCSFLLISFWYTRIQANKSALKAIIVNRISDFGIIFGILFVFNIFSTLDFPVVFSIHSLYIYVTYSKINIITIISLFLFIGAVGKSAQLFLHTWLPDAMEGPTPVSALIHAATMVTAGVSLLVKCGFFFSFSFTMTTIIIFWGALTSIFAATSGLFLSDIKKIIAYSTCSQLGYTILTCGFMSYNLGLFHLINHAIFKAALFLCAGAIIHSLNNEQDMRRMGGLLKILPISYITKFIATLAIIGFPFLTGFFSKDFIFETNFNIFGGIGIYIYSIISITAICTTIYSMRILYSVFLGKTKLFRITLVNIHESAYITSFVLLFLAFGSIFNGFILKELVIGFGYNFLNTKVAVSLLKEIDSEFIVFFLKLIPLFLGFAGLFILCFFNLFWFRFVFFYQKKFNLFYYFVISKWYFDFLNNFFIISTIFHKLKKILYINFDKGLLEFFGPYNGWAFLTYSQQNFIKLQTGNINFYLSMYFFPLFFFIYLLSIFNICFFFHFQWGEERIILFPRTTKMIQKYLESFNIIWSKMKLYFFQRYLFLKEFKNFQAFKRWLSIQRFLFWNVQIIIFKEFREASMFLCLKKWNSEYGENFDDFFDEWDDFNSVEFPDDEFDEPEDMQEEETFVENFFFSKDFFASRLKKRVVNWEFEDFDNNIQFTLYDQIELTEDTLFDPELDQEEDIFYYDLIEEFLHRYDISTEEATKEFLYLEEDKSEDVLIWEGDSFIPEDDLAYFEDLNDSLMEYCLRWLNLKDYITYNLLWFLALKDFGWLYWPFLTCFFYGFAMIFFCGTLCFCLLSVFASPWVYYISLINFIYWDLIQCSMKRELVIHMFFYLHFGCILWFALWFCDNYFFNFFNKVKKKIQTTQVQYWKQDFLLEVLYFFRLFLILVIIFLFIAVFWSDLFLILVRGKYRCNYYELYENIQYKRRFWVLKHINFIKNTKIVAIYHRLPGYIPKYRKAAGRFIYWKQIMIRSDYSDKQVIYLSKPRHWTLWRHNKKGIKWYPYHYGYRLLKLYYTDPVVITNKMIHDLIYVSYFYTFEYCDKIWISYLFWNKISFLNFVILDNLYFVLVGKYTALFFMCWELYRDKTGYVDYLSEYFNEIWFGLMEIKRTTIEKIIDFFKIHWLSLKCRKQSKHEIFYFSFFNKVVNLVFIPFIFSERSVSNSISFISFFDFYLKNNLKRRPIQFFFEYPITLVWQELGMLPRIEYNLIHYFEQELDVVDYYSSIYKKLTTIRQVTIEPLFFYVLFFYIGFYLISHEFGLYLLLIYLYFFRFCGDRNRQVWEVRVHLWKTFFYNFSYFFVQKRFEILLFFLFFRNFYFTCRLIFHKFWFYLKFFPVFMSQNPNLIYRNYVLYMFLPQVFYQRKFLQYTPFFLWKNLLNFFIFHVWISLLNLFAGPVQHKERVNWIGTKYFDFFWNVEWQPNSIYIYEQVEQDMWYRRFDANVRNYKIDYKKFLGTHDYEFVDFYKDELTEIKERKMLQSYLF